MQKIIKYSFILELRLIIYINKRVFFYYLFLLMSVYQGFSTRQLELQYNYLTSLLLITVSKRLVKFYSDDQCNEKAFRAVFYQIMGGLKVLESSKYMPPKYSENMKPFFDLLQSLENKEVQIINMQNDQQISQMLQSNFFEELNKEAKQISVQDTTKRQNHQSKNLIQSAEIRNAGMPAYPLISQEQQESTLEPRPLVYQDQQTQLDSNEESKSSNFQVIQVRQRFHSRAPQENHHHTDSIDRKVTPQTTYRNGHTSYQVPAEKNNHPINVQEQRAEQKLKAYQLPILKQHDIDISQELVDRISLNVENNLMSKLLGPLARSIPKRKNKFRSKSRRNQAQQGFKQLFQEFDNNEAMFNQTYQANQVNSIQRDKDEYQPQGLIRGRGILLPEANKTRSKFYSADTK